VVIGEVRDREVMEQAIYFAETGHLCIATIHANNASQTIERVINFFPEDRHPQILLNLSLNLRATLSQRIVRTQDASRTVALEIMLNRGIIKQHIELGKIRQLREMIEKGSTEGMQTFDQHLLALYQNRTISEEVALAESDSIANLRLQIQNLKTQKNDVNITLRHMQPEQMGHSLTDSDF
jgi:twitching motility protein PilU